MDEDADADVSMKLANYTQGSKNNGEEERVRDKLRGEE